MKSFLKALFMTVPLLVGSKPAIACKYIVLKRLEFSEKSTDLAAGEIAKLAVFINEANGAFAKYSKVTIEGTASVREPGRTLLEAKKVAKLRAENVERVYLQLQPKKIRLTTSSEVHSENRDSAYVQFHIDYNALKLPDCNPVPISTLENR